MPEGPEVRRMAEDLGESICGKKLVDVKIVSGRYTKKPIDNLDIYLNKIPDRVFAVGVHGKFMYILMDSGCSIWSTLGMTGNWSSFEKKHSRIVLEFENWKSYFNDIRNFGTFKICLNRNSLVEKLGSLGPDMLAEDVSDDLFIQRFRKKQKWNICKAMMNQSVVSGIGNYIKAESLWLSEISPNKLVSDLSDSDLKRLNDCTKQIMRASYDSGGATFLTHKNFSGKPGDYSSRFLCYNRKFDAEGNKILKSKTPDGRTTYWSPNKQR